MKKYLILAVLSITAFAFAGEKKYEDGELVDVHMVSQTVTDMDYSNITHPRALGTHSEESPRFLVQVADMQYETDCGFGKLANRYHPGDWTAGTAVKARFNDKRNKIWLQKPDGKEQACSVVRQAKVQ